MIINGFDTNKKVLIVAEIGNNHEGNFHLAKKMIYLAHKAGANAVKFQTYKVEDFILKKNMDRFNRMKKFQLSFTQFKNLRDHALKKKMIFFSTPLDLDSATFVGKLCPVIKIASGDNNYFELIKKLIRLNKPIIISTGMTDDKKIKKIIKFVKKKKNLNFIKKKLILMHCVTSYPVQDRYANLLSIPYLKNKFRLTVGYSDHTLGNEACIVAAGLGARIIEKHFTFNKKYSNFRDHALSADYNDLKSLVSSIRKIEKMLGNYEKKVQKIEIQNQKETRRAIYAIKPMKQNSKILFQNIKFLRPGPSSIELDFDSIKKKKLKKVIKAGSKIDLNKFR